MADESGRKRRGWIFALIASIAALTLAAAAALFMPPADIVADSLSWLVSLGAISAAAGAFYQGRVLARRADKVGSELDDLSTRLVRLEARIAEPDRQAPTGLTNTVAEVTGEIALLGGLVRDLAVTVATQDRDVATLKDQIERTKAPTPAAPQQPQARLVPPVLAAVVDSGQRMRERTVIPSILPIPEQPAAAAAPTAPAPAPSSPAPSAPPAPSPAQPASGVLEIDVKRFGAVLEAYERDRIELHLQPVVSLPQRKPRFYEVLARLRLADDTILVPAEFLPIVERAGLVADFDRKVLTRAAVIARHLATRGSETKVSCNIAPPSLDGGILRTAGRIAEAYPDIADRLILELAQRSWRALEADHAGTIAQLRSRGVSFALDRATDLRLDPLTLAEQGVSFLKLPAEMLLRTETSRGLDVEVADLAAVLNRAGIRLVAERVEREEDVPDLIDLDVPFAQGFVFAPPRAIRPEVLGGAAPAAAPVAAAPAPSAPEPLRMREKAAAPDDAMSEERRPFRTFLRRAG
jgi:cyclic-di-GMP phosphodiesterase TipF (flagellum assembly factor)